MRFVIKGRLDGLNDYIKACRANVYGANAMKRKNQKIVLEAVLEAKGRAIYKYPVDVKITWYEPNSRRDIDNITFAVKFILDALTSTAILIDDSQKYVSSITHKVLTDKDNPRIEVEIMERGIDDTRIDN